MSCVEHSKSWEGPSTRLDKMDINIISDDMMSLELRSLVHNFSWAILHGAVTIQQASLGW
jgi:hypothetical protein